MNSPRLRTFAPCRVLLPRLAKDPKVALGPARANVANVAYLLGIPPVVGTSRETGRRAGPREQARY